MEVEAQIAALYTLTSAQLRQRWAVDRREKGTPVAG